MEELHPKLREKLRYEGMFPFASASNIFQFAGAGSIHTIRTCLAAACLVPVDFASSARNRAGKMPAALETIPELPKTLPDDAMLLAEPTKAASPLVLLLLA